MVVSVSDAIVVVAESVGPLGGGWVFIVVKGGSVLGDEGLFVFVSVLVVVNEVFDVVGGGLIVVSGGFPVVIEGFFVVYVIIDVVSRVSFVVGGALVVVGGVTVLVVTTVGI